jgi:hypothetical protein
MTQQIYLCKFIVKIDFDVDRHFRGLLLWFDYERAFVVWHIINRTSENERKILYKVFTLRLVVIIDCRMPILKSTQKNMKNQYLKEKRGGAGRFRFINNLREQLSIGDDATIFELKSTTEEKKIMTNFFTLNHGTVL